MIENNHNLGKQSAIITPVHFQQINTRSANVESWNFKFLCKIFWQLNVDNWFKVNINVSSSHPSQAKSLHAKLKVPKTPGPGSKKVSENCISVIHAVPHIQSPKHWSPSYDITATVKCLFSPFSVKFTQLQRWTTNTAQSQHHAS